MTRSHHASGRIHLLTLAVCAVVGCLVAAWVGFVALSSSDDQTAARSIEDVAPSDDTDTAYDASVEDTAEVSSAEAQEAEPPFVPSRPIEELRAQAERAVEQTKAFATDLDHPALQRLFGSLQVDLDDAKSFEQAGDIERAARNYESIAKRAARLSDSKARMPDLKRASSDYNEALRQAASLNGPEDERDAFLEASQKGDDAAAAIQEGDFATAIQAFDAGAQTLQTIVQAQRDRVEVARTKGEEALEAGDGAAAKAAFARVLEIDATDASAKTNLDRAQTIELLMPVLSKARALEDQQFYDLAMVEVAKALKIDPLSPRAQAAEKRIIARMSDKAFAEALQAGENAFSQKRYADAIQLLSDALAMRPDHRGAEQLKERADRAMIDQRVAVFVFDGAAAERKGAYQQAFDAYQEALLIQPGRAEAVEGRERAALGIRNAKTAEVLITSAEDRLSRVSLEEVNMAIKELNQAAKLVPLDPRPADLLKKADAVLAELTRPVRVTIYSDGKTNIDFFKVGRFEPFSSKSFDVKPGTYTIKGWRKGYREEVIQITVKPGVRPEPVTVVVTTQL